MRISVLLLAVFLGAVALANSAQAQRAISPYRPAKPALSPYLYLSGPDLYNVPNYQAFVVPAENQRRTNAVQQTEINALQRQTSALLKGAYEPATMTETGIGSSYRNLSHYYPAMSPTARTGPKMVGRAAGR